MDNNEVTKGKRLLKVEEVAVLIGVSVKTINNWYAFKNAYPSNDFSKKLPKPIQSGLRQTRYWKESDIWKLIDFKDNIPKGRNGIMGAITQKYYKKGN